MNFLSVSNNKILYLLISMLFLISKPGAAEKVFYPDTELQGINITSLAYGYIDPGGNLDFNTISSREFSDKFIPFVDEVFDQGYTRDAWWIKINIYNPAGSKIFWLLESTYPLLDYVDFYEFTDGKLRTVKTGDLRPFSTRPLDTRTVVFPVESSPGESSLYLRVKTSGSIIIKLKAWTKKSFIERQKYEWLFLWLFYGLLIGLAVYNIFLFSSVRDRSYLYMGFYIVSIIFATLEMNGLASQVLFPDSPVLANQFHPFSAFLALIGAMVFAREFLNLKNELPVFNQISKCFLYFFFLCIVLTFFTDYYIATQTSAASLAVSSFVLIVAGFVSLVRGNISARLYLFAWMLFCAGILMLMLRAFAVIPDSFLAEWSYQFFASLFVIFQSVAIADKINIIRNEREKALQSLQEADERYRALVENAHGGIMLIDENEIVYANANMIEMTGYSDSGFFYKEFFNLFPDTPRGLPLIKRIFIEGSPFEKAARYEVQIIRKDKSIMDAILSVTPARIDERDVRIALVTDISDIKKARDIIAQQYQEIQAQYEEMEAQYEEMEAMNEELSKSHYEMVEVCENLNVERDRLDITLRSIGEGVITLDVNNRIELMNEVAEKIIGKKNYEVKGESLNNILNLINEKTGADTDEIIMNLFVSDRIVRIDKDIVLICDKGISRKLAMSGSIIFDQNGKKIGAILVISDITERNRMEEEMLKSSKIESLGVFAGGIAHDFNNLLTAIIGNISLARLESKNASEIEELLKDAEKISLRARDLTRQLLTFSRGGAPVLSISCVKDLLEENVAFVLSGSNVKPSIETSPDLWNVEIDEGQISQVIHNFVLNAMQAMPSGGIVRIAAENASPEEIRRLPLDKRDYVKIIISDTGCGISRDNLARIFDPFFTTKVKGNGLGLAVCYSIINRHEGYIDVESSLGKGTTFRIFLPASKKKIDKEVKMAENTEFNGGRILLMDDEEMILRVGANMLEKLGLEVDCARDGLEAVEMCRSAKNQNPYNLVIMDLTVPGGMGGKDAVEKIREFDSEIFVIVSSGYSNDPIMSDYTRYGFSGVIMKPYRMDDLIKMLHEYLGGDD